MSNTDLLSGAATETTASAEAATATTPSGQSSNGTTRKRPAGLSGMVLADLRELAGQLGITGTAGMRKGDLIAAIKARQGGESANGQRGSTPSGQEELPVTQDTAPADTAEKTSTPQPAEQAQLPVGQPAETPTRNRRRRASSRPAGSPEAGGTNASGHESAEHEEATVPATTAQATEAKQSTQSSAAKQPNEQQDERRQGGERERTGNRPQGDRPGGDRPNNRQNNNSNNNDDDDDRGGRRGRRFRDRRRSGGGRTGGRESSGGGDTEIREDDVLLPVGGILDVLENYAFVRTSGYLSGPSDVYVSLSLVRKYGLRRGDAITGVVRQPREGEQQRQKFNPLVRVDKVNGLEPDQAKQRPEFTKMTPLYPNERLRLETEPHILTTRVIDLVMPIGKGQRALIVSPPKAGKTSVLQSIANAIATNNPECHLMVVLVDERPEEVTDMQRSVKGEVIASTFDRPPSDHTTVAELSIERAKRLVEMGHDVVVLLDSITRLGRAYNLAAPASGRILSGGVDSTALYPPKRFLGAARNIEGGGSLTIFATALVETGSTMDTVIFEEFKGTGNAELKLDRKIADKRVFPAVDVDPSSTRKEELLLPPDELAVIHKLRRVLHALDSQQAIDLLLDRLRKTRTNIEFLMQVAKSTPGNEQD
ncbi:MAG TPA: transcription termination factor Rho [Pseudonocardiaceae bacterium]|nr:transcription termination factor Rho [Pseudonocardiaceae bacterium]